MSVNLSKTGKSCFRTHLLSGALAALLFTSNPGTGQIPAASAESGSLAQAQAIIDRELRPLLEQSRKTGLGERVFPDDLPALPYLWVSAGKDGDEVSAVFLDALRTVIAHAVCEADPGAVRYLYGLTGTIEGYFFSEAQALYLERHAHSLGFDARFYAHTRELLRLRSGMSSEPRKIRRINIAFDQRNYAEALNLIPAFAKLCGKAGESRAR